MDLNTKRQLVKDHKDLSMVEQCGLVDLNRSTLYYEPVPYSEEEMRLFNEIDLIYTDMPYYGHRKIWRELMRRGRSIGRDRTLKYMRIMGLEPFYPHKNTSMPDKQHKLYPYLLKDMLICRPNQVWAADITYIRLAKGFCYLIAVIDWYSRYILSYRISTTLEVSFCVDALREALAKYPAPEISNTDQGSQFTSADYTDILLSCAIKISMDSKGRAKDNIIIERFFRSLKHEDVYLKEYLSVAELKAGIARYMFKYNRERLHEALDYRTPAEIYFGRKEVIETEVSELPERKQLLEIAVLTNQCSSILNGSK
ncbi:MAG: IS3 family transposase, partial [Sphingobacteriales bacterium]|nr:IS3 family transposase [Sphingobacteriales bacterium]